METQELGEDDGVMAQRARATAMLSQITRQAKLALTEQSIDMDLFFLIPNSGDAVLTYGTITDPPDDLWDRVGEIVSSVVRQVVGVERTRCRPVLCAATNSCTDQQHSPQPGAHFRNQKPMRYRDISYAVGNRFRLPPSHPVLAEISIDPVHLHDLERLNADNPNTQMVGHDTPNDGTMTVFVAWATEDVRRRLEGSNHIATRLAGLPTARSRDR